MTTGSGTRRMPNARSTPSCTVLASSAISAAEASETDDLNDTVNYAEINKVIHEEMEIPSKLLEHVIGRIFKRLQETFPQIISAKIKLTKTNPPMKGEMHGVSVEMMY